MSVGITLILSIIFSSLWLGASSLINFIIIRTVFSLVDNFFLAGNIGMKLFSAFNKIEIILSAVILIINSFLLPKFKKIRINVLLSIILFSLSLTYFFYLTPKISMLTQLWEQAEMNGTISIHGIPDIQQEHQFFHKLYIFLDSFKLLILTSLITLSGIQIQRLK